MNVAIIFEPKHTLNLHARYDTTLRMAHKHSFDCIDKKGTLLCGQHASHEEEWETSEGPRYIVGEQETPSGRRVFIARPDYVGQVLLDPAELPRERAFDAANLASRQRRAKEDAIEQAKTTAALTTKQGLHGFTVGMSKLQAHRIEEALDKVVSFSKVFARRREHIEDRVNRGWTVRRATKPQNFSGRREIKTGAGEIERIFEEPSGNYFTEKDLTKIGMDYAEFLISRRA